MELDTLKLELFTVIRDTRQFKHIKCLEAQQIISDAVDALNFADINSFHKGQTNDEQD